MPAPTMVNLICVGTAKNKSGFVGGIEIAKPWLPLTRELSSKARLRERKGCGFMRFYFSPSDFLLMQKATSLVRGRQEIVCLQSAAPSSEGALLFIDFHKAGSTNFTFLENFLFTRRKKSAIIYVYGTV